MRDVLIYFLMLLLIKLSPLELRSHGQEIQFCVQKTRKAFDYTIHVPRKIHIIRHNPN